MRDAFANLVFPVLAAGLDLLDRSRRGAADDLPAEQAVLRKLLRGEAEARRLPDYGGDETAPVAVPGDRGVPAMYLGARYALVCWLDEMFILESSWGPSWSEAKLEVELYGTNDRAWKFWEQARLAEQRPTTDALEAFYLCVMLGFAGDKRESPRHLAEWAEHVRPRIEKLDDRPWPKASEEPPPNDVPPLRQRERFRRLVLLATTEVLILVPIVAFALAFRSRP